MLQSGSVFPFRTQIWSGKINQFLNIFPGASERWNTDIKKVQTIIQIRTELSVSGSFFYINIGCRNNTDIDRMHTGAPMRRIPFPAAHAKLGLQSDRNFSNLIQKWFPGKAKAQTDRSYRLWLRLRKRPPHTRTVRFPRDFPGVRHSLTQQTADHCGFDAR